MACQTQRPDNTWPNPVDRLRQEFEKLVEGVMTQGGRAIDMVGLKDLTRPSVFAADILESPEQLQVFVDIAGIDPAQVEITLVGNMLTLKVDRPKVTVTDAKVQAAHDPRAGEPRDRHGELICRAFPRLRTGESCRSEFRSLLSGT